MTNITSPTPTNVSAALAAAMTAAGLTSVTEVDSGTDKLVFGTVPAGWTTKPILEFKITSAVLVSLKDADSVDAAGVLTGGREHCCLNTGLVNMTGTPTGFINCQAEATVYGSAGKIVILGGAGWAYAVLTIACYDGSTRTLIHTADQATCTSSNSVNWTPTQFWFIAPTSKTALSVGNGVDFTCVDGLNRCTGYYHAYTAWPDSLYYTGTSYGQKYGIGTDTYLVVRSYSVPANGTPQIGNPNMMYQVK